MLLNLYNNQKERLSEAYAAPATNYKSKNKIENCLMPD